MNRTSGGGSPGGDARRKKLTALGGVLALGGLVVAVDTLVLRGGGPQVAQAAATPDAPSDATPGLASASLAPLRAPMLAGRLESVGNALGLDPLSVTDAFARVLATGPESQQSASNAPARRSASFSGRNTLSAVLVGSDGGRAVVNGRVLRVGDQVDGYALARLEPGVAAFVRGDEVEILTVERPR